VGQKGTEQAPAFTRLETLTAVIVVGVLALALGLVALAKPTVKSTNQSIGYIQSGRFGYSAKVPKGSPYGALGLSTGQPILLGHVGPVMVSFRYKLTSRAEAEVHGTADLHAMVELAQGLSRQFSVTSKTSFTGREMTLTGRLPLDPIMKYVHSVQGAFQDLGVSSATITVQPKVSVRGALEAHPLKAAYAPKLTFSLVGTALNVNDGTGLDSSGAAAGDPLKPSKKGKVSYKTSVPNTVPLLVVHPPVTLAREIGFGVAGLCLLLGLFRARPLLRSGKDNEPARIRTLYGAHLIEVSDLALKDGPVADVASMDSLADLAKK